VFIEEICFFSIHDISFSMRKVIVKNVTLNDLNVIQSLAKCWGRSSIDRTQSTFKDGLLLFVTQKITMSLCYFVVKEIMFLARGFQE
jgi:hypothetical protein